MQYTTANIYHDRIRSMTPSAINKMIDEKTEIRVFEIESMGADAVTKRLEELDREWDIDRALMLIFSGLVFTQLLAARKNKNWLWGPLIQTPFLFLHATMGWCPPVSILRPLGFRSRQEIQAEREALLKYLSY